MPTQRKTALLLLLLDLLSVILAFNTIAWLRGAPHSGHWIGWPLLGPAAFLIVGVYLIDGYRERTDMLSLDYTSLHTIAIAAGTIGTLLLTYAVIPANYPLQSSRAVILLSFAVCVPMTLSYRRLFYLRRYRRQRRRHVLFIGDSGSCAAFREECRRNAFDRKLIFSDASENAPESLPASCLDRRPFGEILERIRDGSLVVEAIVLRESTQPLDDSLSQRLIELYFQGVPTYTIELFHEVYWRKIALYRLNQTWLFQEGFQIAREPVFERIKRIADVALAAGGLILFGPVILLGAVAVWVEDRGPAFFRQQRIGKNRVAFTLIKLRSMRGQAVADETAPVLEDRHRITRVGRFLRATRLDEFPQLWNVLRGDMSMIGPRAEWDHLVEKYERQIPCYHFRHLVKPGITGWAQVNHPYGATLDNTLRKLEYDLFYIRHFSFVLDASIVLKTIHIMLFGKGS